MIQKFVYNLIINFLHHHNTILRCTKKNNKNYPFLLKLFHNRLDYFLDKYLGFVFHMLVLLVNLKVHYKYFC